MMAKGEVDRRPIEGKNVGAFLAAAVGDAWGWPQEDRSGRTRSSSNGDEGAGKQFSAWIRRTGSRAFRHEEPIAAGDYSDDTQLILAVSRSLGRPDWIKHLVNAEYPTWLLYERGGGRATRAAAMSWAGGRSPWDESRLARTYFQAGGNGVAMRVLPHVMDAPTEFDTIREAVFLNGITTHGHPRALVGAATYAYALWLAVRHEGTLDYGFLLHRLISDVDVWRRLPNPDPSFPDWRKRAAEFLGDYQGVWASAVGEQLELLSMSAQALDEAALPIETDVLTRIGAFGPTKGAGTVTAAAAVFLASRFAARPREGLRFSAFLRGADSDTVASMVGGLLGAIAGSDWLGTLGTSVQDAGYIRSMALRREASRKSLLDGQLSPRAFKAALEARKAGESLILPDGRRVEIVDVAQLRPLSRGAQVDRWILKAEDGQSLFIKRYTKQTVQPELFSLDGNADDRAPHRNDDAKAAGSWAESRHVQVRLPTRNLEHVRRFYGECLECQVTREGAHFAVFNRILSFHEDPEAIAGMRAVTHHSYIAEAKLLIEVGSVRQAFERITREGYHILSPLQEGGRRPSFTCLDPDARPVEVVQLQVSPEKP